MSLRTIPPIGLVWGVLVAATAVSWFFGTDHGPLGRSATAAIVLTVAFVKVRLVGLYFMEIRDAPVWLRAAFEGYVAVVLLALLVLHAAT